MRSHWDVQYSRFVYYPCLPSTHLSLIHMPKFRRDANGGGNWISSSTFTSSLKLLTDKSTSKSILSLTFRDKLLEEHYILNLHLTWPQVSCVPGYPARGSRVVFFSYKDDENQMHKFALRFLTSCETEFFINAVKDCLGDVRVIVHSDIVRSVISSELQVLPSNQPLSSAMEDPGTITPESYCPEEPESLPISDNNVAEYENPLYGAPFNTNPEATMCTYEPEENRTDFPPGFTSLVQNYCTRPEQVTLLPIVPREANLQDEFGKYLQDASFYDILQKVEHIIAEMGDDLSIL